MGASFAGGGAEVSGMGASFAGGGAGVSGIVLEGEVAVVFFFFFSRTG